MKPMLPSLPVLLLLAMMIPCALNARAASPGDLFQAARRGDPQAIEKMIQAGVSVNARDAQGRTALHYAAEGGHLETVEMLIKMGADPNWRDKRGQTPLHLAAAKGHDGTAEALIKFGADPAMSDHEGRTPVDLAAIAGQAGMVELLKRHGTVPNPRFMKSNARQTHNRQRPATVHYSRNGSPSWFRITIGLPFLMLLLLIPVMLITAIRRRGRGGRGGRRTPPATDEAAILRRIWEGLDRMERRADNLETILLRPEDGPTRG